LRLRRPGRASRGPLNADVSSAIMTTARSKLLVIILLAIASFLSGAAAQYYEPDVPFGKVGLASTFAAAVLIFSWFRLDAEERGYERSIGLNIAVLAFALFAIPYYFFKSRDLKPASVATLAFIVLLVALYLLDWLGAIVVWATLQS
jgi:hypothetical protein